MNKIVSTKGSSSLFLAVVLIAGTFAAIYPSFTIHSVQAQPYYGTDRYDDRKSYDKRFYGNDYGYDESQYQQSYKPDYKPQYPSYGKDKSKYISSISINKIKCINDNININGENAGDINAGNKGQVPTAYAKGYSGTGSSGSGYDGEGYSDDNGYNNNKGFNCIINNNNNNNNNNVAGNETIPPEPPKATLNVTKNVTCHYLLGTLDPCFELTQQITEDQFDIEVTNDNPVPSQFPGSESGTIVRLGAGNYVVSETIDDSVDTDLNNLRMQFPGYIITGPQVLFDGDCTDVNPNNIESTEATGTIGEGESQTCHIINAFQASQGGGGGG